MILFVLLYAAGNGVFPLAYANIFKRGTFCAVKRCFGCIAGIARSAHIAD